MFDAWTDINNAQTAQYCHSELANTLFSTHITTVEYVASYSYYFIVSGEIKFYYIAYAMLGISWLRI